MDYAPATLVWVQKLNSSYPQFRLTSPEWVRWEFAQVVQHPDETWTSRVGLHRAGTFIPGVTAGSAQAGMRWAERWVRANWPRIEGEMIKRGNSSAYRTIDYQVFAGRGLAPASGLISTPEST